MLWGWVSLCCLEGLATCEVVSRGVPYEYTRTVQPVLLCVLVQVGSKRMAVQVWLCLWKTCGDSLQPRVSMECMVRWSRKTVTAFSRGVCSV